MSDRKPLLCIALHKDDRPTLTAALEVLADAGWQVECMIMEPEFSDLLTGGISLVEPTYTAT